jgi:hypothetical protein
MNTINKTEDVSAEIGIEASSEERLSLYHRAGQNCNINTENKSLISNTRERRGGIAIILIKKLKRTLNFRNHIYCPVSNCVEPYKYGSSLKKHSDIASIPMMYKYYKCDRF